MEKLQRSVASLAGGSVNSSDFWPGVVQIPFNAWNYVETNLWASLVSHILDVLSNPNETMNEEQTRVFKDIVPEMKIVASAKVEAEERIERIKKVRDAAKEELDKRLEQQKSSARKHAEVSTQDIWTLVTKESTLKAIPGVNKLLEFLRIDEKEVSSSAETIHDACRELSSFGGRLSAVRAEFSYQFSRDSAIRTGVVVLLTLGIGGLIWSGSSGTVQGVLLTIAAPLLGGLGTMAKGFVEASKVVSDAIMPVAELNAELESKYRDKLEENAKKVAEAEEECGMITRLTFTATPPSAVLPH